MGGRGERVQEGVVGFLGRHYGTQENGFYLLSHHSFHFVEFADDLQSVGMLGEYWGLHPWSPVCGVLSLGVYMQFLQGAELQNGPNLEAWVASWAPAGAGCHWNAEELSCGGDGMAGHCHSTSLSGSGGSKEAQCPSGWCFKWELKKFAGYSCTGSAGLFQKHLHLCVWAQGNEWGVKRSSQITLQKSSAEGVVILKQILSHQLLRHRLKVNMQIHLRSAESSSLVLWAFFLNQRAIVQALCWGRTKSLNFYFS